jgi:hypothetical protein
MFAGEKRLFDLLSADFSRIDCADYLRARYLDPTCGRFLGADPFHSSLPRPPLLHR